MSSDGDLSFSYLEAHPRDAARVLERLPAVDSAAFLGGTPARLAAPVLQHMLPLHAAGCLAQLDDDIAAGILHALGAQPAVAVIRHLPEPRRAALIGRLPTTMTVALRLLLGYASNTAGAWMDPGAIAVPGDFRCDEALMRLREAEGDFSQIYVLGNAQRLRGVIDVTRLLRCDGQAPVSTAMRPARHTLPAQAALASVHRHPGWSEQRDLPVLERGERFVGALNFGVMVTALESASAEEGEARGDTLEQLAGAYWGGVSRLIEAVVGALPADDQRTGEAGHDTRS